MTVTEAAPDAHLAQRKRDARHEVLDARRLLEEWAAKVETSTGEIGRLEHLSPDDLASASTATRLSDEMARLRGELQIAQRAVDAQERAVLEAETRYVEACRDLAAAQLDNARTDLAAHEKTTTRLLAALERHDGPYAPRSELVAHINATNADARQHCDPPRRTALAEQVERADRELQILAAVAAGDDPAILTRSWSQFSYHGHVNPEGYLPASLSGPDALLPFRQYLHRRHQLGM